MRPLVLAAVAVTAVALVAPVAEACSCYVPEPNTGETRATRALRDEDFVIVADVTATTTVGESHTETQLANATVRESFKGNMTVGSDVHFRTVTACCLCGLHLSAGRWLLAGSYSAGRSEPSLSSCSVSCLASQSSCAATITAARSQSGRTCSANSECRPAQCCSASHCVPASQAPDCTAALCPAVCREGTMDCGHGTCVCSNGGCDVQWATAPATAAPHPLTPAPSRVPPVPSHSPPTSRCTSDADCVPQQCCHPTTCTVRTSAPACGDVACTEECRGGTMDCGAGSCGCDITTGSCRVNWVSSPPPTNRRRDTLGAASAMTTTAAAAVGIALAMIAAH